MAMPDDLVLVRHGQSEANVMQAASKRGDDGLYTEETVMVPDRSWRLTATGVEQAETTGRWITASFAPFDRHIVSPFVRTRETAARLGLADASWEENRVVRERSWGEIDSIPVREFERSYPENARLKRIDPLYWAPPAGESIANVAENRVRNLLSTLHRENEGGRVLIVTHGEFMWATRLVLQRWSDEEFLARDADPAHRIHNCTAVHFTRLDPRTGERSERLRWVRRAWPQLQDGTWGMRVEDWEEFGRPYLTGDDLLRSAEEQARRFADVDAQRVLPEDPLITS